MLLRSGIFFSSRTFDPNGFIHFRKCPIERIHSLTDIDIESLTLTHVHHNKHFITSQTNTISVNTVERVH